MVKTLILLLQRYEFLNLLEFIVICWNLDLIKLVLTTTWYTLTSQFYHQADGVTMGGPNSSPTKEIHIELNIIYGTTPTTSTKSLGMTCS